MTQAPAVYLDLSVRSTMFLVTSVAMLRERTTGTLERLLSMPVRRVDLLVGYAVVFCLAALLQAVLASAVALGLLGLDVTGSRALVVLLAVLDALLGTALGLLMSAFAQTEFEAMQFLPVVVLPELLLYGLFAPQASMAQPLRWVSQPLPLTYAVDGMQVLARQRGVGGVPRDVLVVTAAIVACLALAAGSLRQRSA